MDRNEHEHVIEVTDLRRVYGGGFEAVRGITFSVARGEVFALLGTNGAGKTSTVELLEGLARPASGRVRVLVVARPALRETLEPTLYDAGIEYDWATDALSAAQLCLDHFFEVALIDAGLHDPESVMAALDLRGRRLRRSVVVFASGDEPGLARLDAEPVAIEEAGATVLGLLQAEQT